MHAVKWSVGALAVLVLVSIGVMVGRTLLPAMSVAQTKGTIVPWFFTWGMILATTVMGLVIAGYMVRIGQGKADT